MFLCGYIGFSPNNLNLNIEQASLYWRWILPTAARLKLHCGVFLLQWDLFKDAALACCVSEECSVGCSINLLVIRGVVEAVCEKGRLAAAGAGS